MKLLFNNTKKGGLNMLEIIILELITALAILPLIWDLFKMRKKGGIK